MVTHVTEPVDPELIELTTDVDRTAPAPSADAPEPGADADSEAQSVIPEFLDKWRHEVEADTGEGGTTERLDLEPTVEDAAADETPVQETAAGGDELVMVERETQEPRRRARPWWLVPLGVVLAVGVVGYFVWLWSLGGDAPEPIPQAVDQTVEPSEEVVDVTVEQLPESEFEAVEEVEAARPPAPIPQPSLGPATVIDSITWSPSADGTEVVLRGNGTIAETTVETFGLSEPPRILVRIRQIQQEYSSYELPVGTPEVDRIRIGHHPELTPPALYVVLDLARADVRVTGISVEGDTARVTVR